MKETTLLKKLTVKQILTLVVSCALVTASLGGCSEKTAGESTAQEESLTESAESSEASSEAETDDVFYSYKYGATYEDSVFTFGPIQLTLPDFIISDDSYLYTEDWGNMFFFEHHSTSGEDSSSEYLVGYNGETEDEIIEKLESLNLYDVTCVKTTLGKYPALKISYTFPSGIYFISYSVYPDEPADESIYVYILSKTDEAYAEAQTYFDSITEAAEPVTADTDKETLMY